MYQINTNTFYGSSIEKPYFKTSLEYIVFLFLKSTFLVLHENFPSFLLPFYFNRLFFVTVPLRLWKWLMLRLVIFHNMVHWNRWMLIIWTVLLPFLNTKSCVLQVAILCVRRLTCSHRSAWAWFICCTSASRGSRSSNPSPAGLPIQRGVCSLSMTYFERVRALWGCKRAAGSGHWNLYIILGFLCSAYQCMLFSLNEYA